MRQHLRLNCNDCGGFTTYQVRADDPKTVVRCKDCGKRHSTHSIFMIDPNKEYDRDSSGTLLESPI